MNKMEKRLREQEEEHYSHIRAKKMPGGIDPLLRFVYEAMYRISCVILGQRIYGTEPSDTRGVWKQIVVKAWIHLTKTRRSFPEYCHQLSIQRFESIHCWDTTAKVSPVHKP